MLLNKAFLPVPAVFVLLLAACGGAASPEVAEIEEEPAAAAEEITEASVAAPTETPQEIGSAWVSQFPALPAAPQEVSIPTEDGRSLVGIYYPAKVNPAPIVVLMHWGGGDMTDWRVIAPWLQNRADEQSRIDGLARPLGQVDGPWLDPSWFPGILPEASFGVLVFDYNGFGQTPFATVADALLKDSLAAMLFASQLEGADPNVIVALGGSLGADGAVDGCYLFNQMAAEGTASGNCVGAMALSPGNFITSEFTFGEAVKALSDERSLVVCLAAELDETPAALCEELSGMPAADVHPVSFIYSGDPHAMFLIDPSLTPADPLTDRNALDLLLEFLEYTAQKPVASK